MVHPRPRIRAADVLVVAVSMALCLAPLGIHAMAAPSSTLDQPLSATQEVAASVGIGRPVTGSFTPSSSGMSTGQVTWDAWATSNGGFKLTVHTNREPAMQSSSGAVTVDDQGATPSAWSVPAGQRRFGFSVRGEHALAAYQGGNRWRGFQGARPIEASRRRGGAAAQTRTTIRLRSEMRSALPSGTRVSAHVVGTVTENL